MPLSKILSPSDLVPGGPSRVFVREGERIRVAGRVVVSREGEGERIAISDAYALVDVAIPAPSGVTHGELAIFEGDYARGVGLVNARLDGTFGGKPASLEIARFRDRGVGATLAARARALEAVREVFSRERFLEVETPSMVPSPGLDVHLDAFQVDGRPERYLITSPEYQMKRLLTGGVPRCFQIARCYRRSELGERHNPEFTMVEWYRAFASMDAILGDIEALVRAVVKSAGRDGRLVHGDHRMEIDAPFRRLSVAEAFRDIAGTTEEEMLRVAVEDETEFFRVLVDTIEPALARAAVPTVLHRYPASMASLARLADDDRRYAERFEVYACGIELSNGFVELTDAAEQRERLERDQRDRKDRGLPVYPIDERFLAALEEGMPPASGNALGFDRLLMLATGAVTIADVVAFPDGEL